MAVEEAAEHEGWRSAAALIEESWDRLVATDPRQLLGAFMALPGAAFVENPGLTVAASHLRHVVNGGDTSSVSSVGHVHDGPLPDDLLARLIVLTGQSTDARTKGRAAEAARVAEECLEHLARAGGEAARRIATSLPHLRMQWACSLDAADIPRARTEYAAAYEAAQATKQPWIARRSAAHAAWLHAERGRLQTAEVWVRRARAVHVSDDRYDAALLLAEALMSVDHNDLAHARRLLDEADAIGTGRYWAADLWTRSVHAHTVAEAAIVESRLASVLEEHPEALTATGFDGRLTRAARVRVLMLRGRIAENLDSSVDLSMSDRVIAAAIARLEGRDHAAFELSRPATEVGVEPRLQSNALLVHAAAANALGYTDTAISTFTRAEAVIQHEGLYLTYEVIGPADVDALLHLTGIERTGFVRGHSVRFDLPQLTKRENDTLSFLLTDLTMEEIAKQLFISRNTLKSMTRRLYRKLGVSSRSAAVDQAHRAGFGNHATS